jgi:hypothetical protein
MSNCERCNARPPRATSGEFIGQELIHDYCFYCSQNLCDKCMREGKCASSPNDKHKADDETETE